jgi:hypothetical protein
LLVDPVVDRTGDSMNRESLVAWLKTRATLPSSREPVDNGTPFLRSKLVDQELLLRAESLRATAAAHGAGDDDIDPLDDDDAKDLLHAEATLRARAELPTQVVYGALQGPPQATWTLDVATAALETEG